MELWSHTSRLISLAISDNGQILASGDEAGNVKLVMLQLLTHMIPRHSSNNDDSKHSTNKKVQNPSVPSFRQVLPEYKFSMNIHDGNPVLSLQWLPIPYSLSNEMKDEVMIPKNKSGHTKSSTSNEMTKNYHYALATGSNDRAILIWKICCNNIDGLSADLLMVLDMLCTHTLTLHALLVAPMKFPFMQADNKEISSHHKQQHYHLDKENNHELAMPSSMTDFDSSSCVFIAAGTKDGTIYLWQISFSLLVDMMCGKLLPQHLDDGSHLHSIVQVGDRPLVSINLMIDAGFNMGKNDHSIITTTATQKYDSMLIVVNDSEGCVRSYSGSTLSAESTNGDRSYQNNEDVRLTVRREVYLRDAVVSCSLQVHEPLNLTMSNQDGIKGKDHIEGLNERNRLLLVSVGGNIQVINPYDLSTMPQSYEGSKKKENQSISSLSLPSDSIEILNSKSSVPISKSINFTEYPESEPEMGRLVEDQWMSNEKLNVLDSINFETSSHSDLNLRNGRQSVNNDQPVVASSSATFPIFNEEDIVICNTNAVPVQLSNQNNETDNYHDDENILLSFNEAQTGTVNSSSLFIDHLTKIKNNISTEYYKKFSDDIQLLENDDLNDAAHLVDIPRDLPNFLPANLTKVSNREDIKVQLLHNNLHNRHGKEVDEYWVANRLKSQGHYVNTSYSWIQNKVASNDEVISKRRSNSFYRNDTSDFLSSVNNKFVEKCL